MNICNEKTALLILPAFVYGSGADFKNGPTPASFRLFSVFSNKQYNFYNKSMWKNVHAVYGAGIWTHNLSEHDLSPITTSH